MNARAAVFVCLLGMVQGCDEPSGSPFSPTAPSAPPCPLVTCQLLPFHMSGVATDDDGRPVSGAKITVRPFIFGRSPAPVITETDAAGFYRVEFEAMRDSALGGIGTAGAERPGRENHWRLLLPSIPQEFVQNFHLYQVKRIRPGEPVSVIVRPDDGACGFDGEWVCRTVRVSVPQAGTLRVALVSHHPRDLTGLEVYEGPPRTMAGRCCAPEVSIRAAAATEMTANILVWGTTETSHSFTLDTSFVPE